MLARLPHGSAGDAQALLSILNTAAITNRLLLQDVRVVGSRHVRFRLALNRSYYFRRGSYVEYAPYTRLNYRLNRTVAAVCWHGHRDFFLSAYDLCPDIHFTTALATYHNFEDFEAKFPDTAYKNIGSQMEPCNYADACYCDA